MNKKVGDHTDCLIFPSLVFPYPLDWLEWFNLMMQICRYCYLCWYSQSCQGMSSNSSILNTLKAYHWFDVKSSSKVKHIKVNKLSIWTIGLLWISIYIEIAQVQWVFFFRFLSLDLATFFSIFAISFKTFRGALLNALFLNLFFSIHFDWVILIFLNLGTTMVKNKSFYLGETR